MELLTELEKLGVNVKEGLDRVMGDESLYTMMLDMFLTAVQTTPVDPEEFDRDDRNELIGKIHALKGTTGNLSMDPLFTRYTKSLELLRKEQPAEAKAVFAELIPVQAEIVACIQRHSA